MASTAAEAPPGAPAGQLPKGQGVVLREQTPSAKPAAAKSTGAGFSYSYKAERFEPPRPVIEAPPGQVDRSSPVASYRTVFAANRGGAKEAILEQFTPEDRAGVAARMDEESLRRNRVYFESMVEERIAEVVEYGPFRILIIVAKLEDGDVHVRNVPMVETAEGWLCTNALVKDVFLNFLVEGINEQYRTQ